MALTEQDKVDIEQIIGEELDKFTISPGRVYPGKRFAVSTLFVFLVVVVISLGGVLSINATCGHIRTQLDHMNDSLDQFDQRIRERGAILQRLDDRTEGLGSTNSGSAMPSAMPVTKTREVSPAY